MDVVKSLLAARPDKSPQVQALLDCLSDASFGLQVAVCSVGGVGSTEVCNFLTTRAGLACNLLTDTDATRHANRPPAHLGHAGAKVLYLFSSNPLASVASHYRRGHAHHQALKTSGGALRLDEASFPATLQAYVDRNQDLFGLEQHLRNWLMMPSGYDVLFVRYEDMFDLPVARAMFKFLLSSTSSSGNDCQAAAASSSAATAAAAVHQHHHMQQGHAVSRQAEALAEAFAARKRERASCVTPEQQQAMTAYHSLADEARALPAIFVRAADGSRQRLL